MQLAVEAGAGGRHLDDGGLGGAGREQFDVGRKTQRDRWNDREAAAGLGLGRAGHDLHRLIGNRERLAAHFKHVFDGKRRRILRPADQARIVHAEHSRRSLLAQPIRLARRRAGG